MWQDGWNSHGSREDRRIMWLVDRPVGKLLSSPERRQGCVTIPSAKVLSECKEAFRGS